MQTRTLGRTGLEVSVLGFGCGAVGGLMVKGNAADQEPLAHAVFQEPHRRIQTVVTAGERHDAVGPWGALRRKRQVADKQHKSDRISDHCQKNDGQENAQLRNDSLAIREE